MYMNSYNPYNLFNQNIFENNQIRQVQEHHREQQKKVLEMRKAISDYCEAARKISPDYWEYAGKQCMQELLIQAAKDGYKRQNY